MHFRASVDGLTVQEYGKNQREVKKCWHDVRSRKRMVEYRRPISSRGRTWCHRPRLTRHPNRNKHPMLGSFVIAEPDRPPSAVGLRSRMLCAPCIIRLSLPDLVSYLPTPRGDLLGFALQGLGLPEEPCRCSSRSLRPAMRLADARERNLSASCYYQVAPEEHLSCSCDYRLVQWVGSSQQAALLAWWVATKPCLEVRVHIHPLLLPPVRGTLPHREPDENPNDRYSKLSIRRLA